MSFKTPDALLETKISYMYRNKYARDFSSCVIYEGVDVAESDGTYFDPREALDMAKKFV